MLETSKRWRHLDVKGDMDGGYTIDSVDLGMMEASGHLGGVMDGRYIMYGVDIVNGCGVEMLNGRIVGKTKAQSVCRRHHTTGWYRHLNVGDVVDGGDVMDGVDIVNGGCV